MLRPKVHRICVLTTSSGDDPGQIPHDSDPPLTHRVFGDGVVEADYDEAIAFARAEQARYSGLGERVWLWIGHDAAFLCGFWRWYVCVGPAGWTSPRLAASDASRGVVAANRDAERAAAVAATLRHNAERAAARKAGKKVAPSHCRGRGRDLIVELGRGDGG